MMNCACKSAYAYRCWEVRYGPRDWDVGEVDADGGPCECGCHDDADDSDGCWSYAIAALRDVKDKLCEGFCKDFPSAATYDVSMDNDCSACRSRAALAKAGIKS